MMIHFECDYVAGAHPKVLQALIDTNFEACPGYGADEHCRNAAAMLKRLCQAPDAEVHFLTGGTQTNMTVIAAALRPHQGVISPVLGHINDHETGAVEATGHKILPLDCPDGKLTARQVEQLCLAHYGGPSVEHTVQPGMIYISQPTELGTLYSLDELTALRQAADRHNLLLFADGARLAYALPVSDVTLADMARLCDVFYFGGTKAGILFGEAVVITNDALKKDFRYLLKQRGGMLAKGRLLGVQFEALFEQELFLTIGRRAVAQAARLQQAFLDKGFSMLVHSPTNQLFPILPNSALASLDRKYCSCLLQPVDHAHTAVRFCTGWSTTDDEVDALLADIQAL